MRTLRHGIVVIAAAISVLLFAGAAPAFADTRADADLYVVPKGDLFLVRLPTGCYHAGSYLRCNKDTQLFFGFHKVERAKCFANISKGKDRWTVRVDEHDMMGSGLKFSCTEKWINSNMVWITGKLGAGSDHRSGPRPYGE